VAVVEPEHLDATTAWYQRDSHRLDLNTLAATPAPSIESTL